MVNIMKKISVILLLLPLLLAGAIVCAAADEVVALSPDEALLALINEARRNPLEMAASLGMDPEKIVADLPELENILTNGLYPLALNATLAEAASAHTGDMFARGYYSTLSPDGLDYDERICEAGYPAVLSGESLGMILFANFISPEDAARLIFEYMFQDELDPTRTEKRNILDPCLKEAGISLQSGTLSLGGARWNVYLATCDFGSLLSCPESELFELINQARENPLQMAESLDMDPARVLADFPEWEDVLTQGLPPLSFNMNLAAAARAHAADMLENGYYSCASSDGRTVEERILEAGYDVNFLENSGETLWRMCLGEDDGLLNDLEANNYDQIQKLMQQTFKNMFTCELMPTSTGQKNILNAAFNEIGIGLAAGVSPELETLCGDRVMLLVMDFGSSAERQDEPLENEPTQSE